MPLLLRSSPLGSSGMTLLATASTVGKVLLQDHLSSIAMLQDIFVEDVKHVYEVKMFVYAHTCPSDVTDLAHLDPMTSSDLHVGHDYMAFVILTV